MPTICGAPSLAPLTTGIWLTSALSSRSSRRKRGSSGEVHRIFFARNHGGLNRVVGPLVARNGVERVNVHHADEAVVADHEMATAPRAQHFCAIFFERDVSWNCGHFLAHDVGGAEAGEGLPNRHLSDAFLRGVQNEPANEGNQRPFCTYPLNAAYMRQESWRTRLTFRWHRRHGWPFQNSS